MTDHSDLLEMSDEEAEWIDSLFNPTRHGEVRVEFDEAKSRYIVNWYDNYMFSYSFLDMKTPNEKESADAFLRLHKDHVNLTEKSKRQIEDIQQLKEQIVTLNRKIYGYSLN